LTHQWQTPSFEEVELQTRKSHTACLFDANKILVYGGEIMSHIPRDVLLITVTQGPHQYLSFNIQQIEMKEQDPRRSDHSAQVSGDKMYIFGGVDPQGRASDELWSLDLKDLKWTKCPQKGAIPS